MWVAGFDTSGTKKDEMPVAEGKYSGGVFTEIDHGYINPASDKYEKQLNDIIGGNKREKWINADGDGKFYGTGYKVFNEYMTHAVYLLYAKEQYKAGVYEKIAQGRIKMMIERRGYYQFEKFAATLFTLRQQYGRAKKVEELYSEMIEWCKLNS